jgi:hypothetical protein
MKRKRDKIDGHDPWEIEIDFYVAKGLPRDWAEVLVVRRRLPPTPGTYQTTRHHRPSDRLLHR